MAVCDKHARLLQRMTELMLRFELSGESQNPWPRAPSAKQKTQFSEGSAWLFDIELPLSTFT